MKFRLLFRIRGNGRVGSSVVGLRTGTISRLEVLLEPLTLLGGPIVAPHEADAFVAQGGNELVVEHAVLLRDERARLLARRFVSSSLRREVVRARPAPALTAADASRPETRISKNSSRFVEEMQRNFNRSSSGTTRVLRLLQARAR